MKKKQRKSNTVNARWMKVNFLNFSVADIDIYWLLLFGVFLKKVSSIGKFPSIGKMTLNVISHVWLTPWYIIYIQLKNYIHCLFAMYIQYLYIYIVMVAYW